MNGAHQTLLQQMRMTDLEVQRRKELLQFTRRDADALVKCKALIRREIDDIVARFYEVQTSIDEIALLIGDADTLRRLQGSQRRYILDLFGGTYDLDYVNNRLRIGLVHKRIGVEPKLYLSAVHVLRELLTEALRCWPLEDDTREAALTALDKLLYFDVTLVFETYIRSLLAEIEVAKEKSEQYARSLEAKVIERTHALDRLTRTDPLTGVYNRRVFDEVLTREVQAAQRRRFPLSLVYIDVDNFKEINDRLGHQRGDEVLSTLGEILRSASRSVDACFRYGGDEFCIILPDCTEKEAKEHFCERVRALAAEEVPEVTLSIGFAQTGPETYDAPDALLARADANMYEAKRAGREAS